RVIPLDILIDSDAYFTGAYPALASVLENVEPKRIPIARVIANAQIHRYTEIAKKQYGKFINFLNLMHQDSEHVIKLMTDGFLITDIPDRLKIPLWSDSIGDI
ncbi:replication protein, partial [Vibrio anguillarum]|nr:replication protein [Vibrio anguillarum]